ncbi:MAG: 7-carboxy-7-deazaguanine synthase QueE [Nitrososphaerales archaeon]
MQGLIPVSEIFYSIQGEGINIGKPAVFLRTYYCNLNCCWCDSKYTWENQSKAKEGIDYFNLSPEDLIYEIAKYPCKHLVITGGEPLIHQNSLLKLIRRLKEMDYYIEVESNGTIKPLKDFLDLIDCFNLSPKLSNSGIEGRRRLKEEVLKLFTSKDKTYFKFVICERKDLDEVGEIIKLFSIKREKVILMPEGTNTETLNRRSEWLIEECKKRGFRFSPRLHILIYGNRRGL